MQMGLSLKQMGLISIQKDLEISIQRKWLVLYDRETQVWFEMMEYYWYKWKKGLGKETERYYHEKQ